MATYYGAGDELHLAFNFPPIFQPWDAAAWQSCIDGTLAALAPRDAWPTWALSNHDFVRHRTRFGGSEARARAAAVLLTCLRGTPFLYMGEELGLEDAIIPPAAVVDPGGRDGCRAPIPWATAAGHGWPATPWLPFAPHAAERSWQAQRDDATSMLSFYKRLLAHRRASPALRRGSMQWLPADDGVLAWERRDASGDRRVVIVSFADQPRRVTIDGAHRITVATEAGRDGELYDGTIGADAAIVLQPTP